MAISQPIQVGSLPNFQGNFLQCSKMIQNSKVDSIFLNSNQEPSASSMYGHILDALLITLGT